MKGSEEMRERAGAALRARKVFGGGKDYCALAGQPEGGSAPPRPPGLIEVRLHELIAARGVTLAELSRHVGVTVVNLSVLKNGHARAIRFSTLARLCEVLDCQPGDLLSWGTRAGEPPGRPPAGTPPGGISASEAETARRGPKTR